MDRIVGILHHNITTIRAHIFNQCSTCRPLAPNLDKAKPSTVFHWEVECLHATSTNHLGTCEGSQNWTELHTGGLLNHRGACEGSQNWTEIHRSGLLNHLGACEGSQSWTELHRSGLRTPNLTSDP